MKRLAAGLFAALAAMPAHAGVPVYDVNQSCAGFERTQHGVNECIEQEQSNYDLLKLTWDGIAPDIRLYCVKAASSMLPLPFFYARIVNCVARLDTMRQLNTPQHFRP